MWDKHLGCINVAKHCINLINYDVGQFQFSSYRAGRTVKKISGVEYGLMILKKEIEPATTERAASIMFSLKNYD